MDAGPQRAPASPLPPPRSAVHICKHTCLRSRTGLAGLRSDRSPTPPPRPLLQLQPASQRQLTEVRSDGARTAVHQDTGSQLIDIFEVVISASNSRCDSDYMET